MCLFRTELDQCGPLPSRVWGRWMEGTISQSCLQAVVLFLRGSQLSFQLYDSQIFEAYLSQAVGQTALDNLIEGISFPLEHQLPSPLLVHFALFQIQLFPTAFPNAHGLSPQDLVWCLAFTFDWGVRGHNFQLAYRCLVLVWCFAFIYSYGQRNKSLAGFWQ